MNIITIAHSGMPGVQSVFKNLEQLGISKNIELDNMNQLPDPNDIVIFGSFHQSYISLLNILKAKRQTVGILWTSSVSETQLQSGEISLLMQVIYLRQQGKIDFIWFLKKDFTEVYTGNGIFHVSVPIPEYKKTETEWSSNQHKFIALFMPDALKKNWFAQILAAKVAKKHDTNIQIRTNLPISDSDITSLGWMEPNLYENEIKHTYLALHVSHAESFAYGAYQFLARGIPCLISPTIADNFHIESNSKLYDYLVVSNPDSISEISNKILYFTQGEGSNNYKFISEYIYSEMQKLRTHNNQEIQVVFKELEKVHEI